MSFYWIPDLLFMEVSRFRLTLDQFNLKIFFFFLVNAAVDTLSLSVPILPLSPHLSLPPSLPFPSSSSSLQTP